MKKIYSAQNPMDAHLLKGILEGQGIQGMVQGDSLWGARGEIPLTPETCPSVWIIDDADYDRALEIVHDFESKETDNGVETEKWKCSTCNEINEGQFTECWQCGTSRN